MPGSDLLWHGLRPHYHRRRAFSLPSSEWDRVVPARYCRQASWLRLEVAGIAAGYPRLQSGSFSASTLVAFAMDRSIVSIVVLFGHLPKQTP
jgi:hypothetical protein